MHMIFWSRLIRFARLVAAGLLCAALPAQEPAREVPATPPALRPPDKPPGEGRDRSEWRGRGGPDGERHGGDRRGPPGKSLSGRPPMWGEGFEKLNEQEKTRVREALGKAWGRPEVAAARDKLMAANDEMRRALNAAVQEIDPEAAAILSKMRGPDGHAGPGRGEPPRLPPVESDDFPVAVVKRLETELLIFSPPERRDAARELHARLLAKPAIGEAVRRLNSAATGERIKAMEELRKIYREAVSEEWRKLREESGKDKTGPGTPPSEAPEA